MSAAGFLAASVALSFALLSAALGLAFVRVLRGPTLPDRAVGLDLITTLALGLAGIYAVYSGEALFIDVALAVALVGFLATIAFARYTERAASLEGDVDTEVDE